MASAASARRIARYAYLGLILLFLAGVLAQALLAGRFMFAGADVEPHAALGWPLAHMLAPLALLLSFFLKGGRTFWVTSLVWGVLAIVQPILATLAKEEPSEVAALHVVNALVLFALTLWLSQRAWRLAKEKPAPPPAPKPPRAPPMPGPTMRR